MSGNSGAPAPVRAATATALPIAAMPGKRHLVDATGSPFLIHGDFAASLISQLTREEVDVYLDDRQRRGFNTIAVALMQRHFATNAPANAYGQPPFLIDEDFGTPNDLYFDHVDWVLRRAEVKGMLVLLAPAFLGAAGGHEGWYRAMVAGGTGKLREFGRYLGRRYGQLKNILWVHAGDFNPTDKSVVRAVAEGIQEFDGRSLSSAHCAPDTAAIEIWGDEPWLRLNNVYTYDPVYAPALRQYRRREQMPFILIESRFENEFGGNALRARTQAYQALLSGACGQIFGNNPIWHFDSPNAPFPAPTTWRQALDSPGARSMTHLVNLITGLRWWLLEPDSDGALLVSGHGPEQSRAVAARSMDGSFALVYIPSPRTLTLDLRRLAGSQVTASWYDPAGGEWLPATSSPLTAGLQRLTHARCNSGGAEDWVLVLRDIQ